MRFTLAAAITILLWSIFPLTISSVQSLGTFEVVLYAQALSLVPWLVYLVFGRHSLSEVYRAARTRSLLLLIIVSGICNALEYFSFFLALRQTNPIIPTVIFESWVVFMVIFDVVIFSARMKPGDAALIVLAFFGVTIIITDPGAGTNLLTAIDRWAALGLVASVCAGLKASLNSRIAEKYQDRYGYFVASIVPHFLTVQVALVAYIIALLISLSAYGLPLVGSFEALAASPLDVLRLFAIGMIIMGLANPAFIYALRTRPTEAYSAVFYLIPLLATFWLVQFGRNELTYFITLGGITTIIVIMLISIRSLRMNAMLGTALTSLIATYAIITLSETGATNSGYEIVDSFLIEMAILIFSLVGVFGIERVSTTRRENERALLTVASRLVRIYQSGECDVRHPGVRETFDEIGKRIAFVEFAPRRSVPMRVMKYVIDQARSLDCQKELVRDFEESLYSWVEARNNFYPVSHLVFLGAFGLVCGAGIILLTVANGLQPLFAIFIVCGISYVIFYIVEFNVPALQEQGRAMLNHRIFQMIGKPPVFPKSFVDRMHVSDGQELTVRVYEGNDGLGRGEEPQLETVELRESEPLFVRHLSEVLFLISLVASVAWLLIKVD
jgi:drug/metabolite transporter (DMT)-like permease